MSEIAKNLNNNAFTKMHLLRYNNNYGTHMYHCPLKVANSFNLSQLKFFSL